MTRKIVSKLLVTLIIIGFVLGFIKQNIPSLYSVLTYLDEAFILILFIYNIKEIVIKHRVILLLTILYILVGFIGGLIQGAPLNILAFGSFISTKSFILYMAISVIPFKSKDIDRVFKVLDWMFPFIYISLILDLVIGPSFRETLNLGAGDIRMGIRAIGGLFSHLSVMAFAGMLYYLIYSFIRVNKMKKILSLAMIFLPIKIKEIFAFILTYFMSKFKKISVKVIVSSLVVFMGVFTAYQYYLPDHYNTYFNTDNTDNVARLAMIATSIEIAKDRFPLGEGCGRFGGTISSQYYSPVYHKYGIDNIWGLQEDSEFNFIQDTFWPMILGESGILGLMVYIGILIAIFKNVITDYFEKKTMYNQFVVYMLTFFLIASAANPVFVNSPHNLVLFGIFGMMNGYARCTYFLHIRRKKTVSS